MNLIIFFKIIFFITLVFFSYMGYFGITEYRAFTNSDDYKNTSIFEKLVVNSIFYLGTISLSTIVFSYIYLIFYSTIQ